jgi:hypothetical protein
MTSTAWTFSIPADRVEEFGNLLTELNGTPRFASFGMPPAFGEPLLSWDATTAVLDAKEKLS